MEYGSGSGGHVKSIQSFNATCKFELVQPCVFIVHNIFVWYTLCQAALLCVILLFKTQQLSLCYVNYIW